MDALIFHRYVGCLFSKSQVGKSISVLGINELILMKIRMLRRCIGLNSEDNVCVVYFANVNDFKIADILSLTRSSFLK